MLLQVAPIPKKIMKDIQATQNVLFHFGGVLEIDVLNSTTYPISPFKLNVTHEYMFSFVLIVFSN